jgi:hypothetical protein
LAVYLIFDLLVDIIILVGTFTLLRGILVAADNVLNLLVAGFLYFRIRYYYLKYEKKVPSVKLRKDKSWIMGKPNYPVPIFLSFKLIAIIVLSVASYRIVINESLFIIS